MRKAFLIVLSFILFLSSCDFLNPEEVDKEEQSQQSSTKEQKAYSLVKDPDQIIEYIDCKSEGLVIKHKYAYGKEETHWSREVTLPATGKFVEESHYVTTRDEFTERSFPNSKDERINEHLELSFELYKKYDSTITIEELYPKSWNKVWTPQEGGHFGQGSVGDVQLNELKPEMEMWFLTMMWDIGHRPKRGTKFLLRANQKSVVVIAGFETGPGSERFLGGVTREVHAWLGTGNSSEIEISKLSDQNVPIGPVKCN